RSASSSPTWLARPVRRTTDMAVQTVARPAMRKPKPARSPWLHVFMIPLTLLWLVPLIFVVFVAIRDFDDLASRGLGAFPRSFSWEGFSTAFAGGGLLRALGNSVIVTAVGVA